MAIYEIASNEFRRIDETSFSIAGVRERQDLQRLLRTQIEIVAQDTLIICEEFGHWEESYRRIDLLGIDKDANLVVFELKRTEDGGHMELQSIRYAAMVSCMTFERAVEVYSNYLKKSESELDALSSILDFLEWDEVDEELFAQDVRIVLVSAEFSKELTTSVIWLNDRGIDIQCIRIKPYSDNGRVLVDIQQIIPLPEAEDYTIRIKAKQQRERVVRKLSHQYTKFDLQIGNQTYQRLTKRGAVFTVVQYLFQLGKSPEEMRDAVSFRPNTMFLSLQGNLSPEEFLAAANENAIQEGTLFKKSKFYCDEGELFHSNERTFALTKHWSRRTKEAIENLIESFADAEIEYSVSD